MWPEQVHGLLWGRYKMGKKYVVTNQDGLIISRILESIHQIPKEAIRVTDEDWKKIIDTSLGDWMINKSGKISFIPRDDPPLTFQDIERFRIIAYSDPISGSDRLFSEAVRMQIMGEEGYEEVRARAVARFEEIQAQYPWPAK